ncbi:hypothetical protein KCV01_g9131, partial [Aureobasidium melanogenum]
MKNLFFTAAVLIAAVTTSSPNANAQAAPPSASPSTAIVSSQSGQCFDVTGYSTASGAVIQQYPCTGTTNQMWSFQVFNYNGFSPIARIVNVNSGMCASAESSTPSNGVIGLNQRPCDVNDTLQQFTVSAPFATVQVSSGQFLINVGSYQASRSIRNVGTNWCLRTQEGFGRPYLAAACGTDINSYFKLSGI